MKNGFLVILGLVAGIAGCGQGNERLAEKASIEGKASAKAGLEAESQYRATRASEMEADLADRHRFYQAIKGNYEGTLKTEQGTFSVKITLVPSLPPFKAPRVRQLDEIVSDLNNLYITAQVVQWNPANRLSAVGCRVEHVRPDILTGEIYIASESCTNLYALRVGMERAVDSQVTEIAGEVHPSTNASVYFLNVSRVSR